MKSKRSLIIVSIFMLLIGLTAVTYAAWDMLTKRETNTFNVGSGTDALSVELLFSNNSETLIPPSGILKEYDTYEIIYTYQLTLSPELIEPLYLNVYVNHTLPEYLFFSIEPDSAILTPGVPMTVDIKLTMDPLYDYDDQHYLNSFTFDVIFTASESEQSYAEIEHTEQINLTLVKGETKTILENTSFTEANFTVYSTSNTNTLQFDIFIDGIKYQSVLLTDSTIMSYDISIIGDYDNSTITIFMINTFGAKPLIIDSITYKS
jgi:hypothetical protein